MADSIFTLENLSFAYGRHEVIRSLDLTLREGKITTLIGANGCGKSTLFSLMTKNLRPDGGRILLRGQDIAGMKLREFARQAAIVHQYNTAPADLSVEKLVGYGRTPYHTMGLSPDPAADEEKIRWALGITNTEKLRDKPVAELSGGQKQRVAIVRALCMHPEILLFDEVTAALDPEMVREVLDVMLDLAREGKTMIIVTHEMQFARAVANRVLFLDGGRIVEEAAPAQFFDHPQTERAKKFLNTFTFDAVK